jgi:hypothetical protein
MAEEMDIMEDYGESADMLQESADDMLPTVKGRFSKSALNGLVKSFNKSLEVAGFPGDYPMFDGDQTTLPVDFVRGLAMMADAAEVLPTTGASLFSPVSSMPWQSQMPLRRR